MKYIGRFVTFVVLIFILMVLIVPVGAVEPVGPSPVGLRPDAPTYALHGPYWVGTMAMVIEDPDRPLPITVWYPALNPDNLEEAVEYDIGLGEMLPPELNLIPGHALLDAQADKQQAPYPLVIYSPANTASRLWAVYYQEHLASYGFVVIAVDHPGTTGKRGGIENPSVAIGQYEFHTATTKYPDAIFPSSGVAEAFLRFRRQAYPLARLARAAARFNCALRRPGDHAARLPAG